MTDVGNSSTPSLPRLEPGAIFAGYRIEGVLDRGGMGVVYRASDPDLDRSIALKIIAPEHTQNPTAVARFKSEARLAASLEHPNIVPIHRGGEHEGVLYLAMRLVPGTNLRQIIDRGPLELPRVARIVSEVADALDTAHAAGLVHRDVKPANILLGGENHYEHAYLTDFGLTKRLGSAGDLTRTGGWVGTPDYVAPEQIQGHNVDGRADIYSLGCVVYEMLTGHVAYPKDSHMAKLWAHVTDPPPLPRRDRPDLVESFDAVVARATAKEPGDRYQSAGELAAALRAAVGGQEAKRQFDAAQMTEAARWDERSTHDEPLVGAPPNGGAGHPAAAAAPPPPASGTPTPPVTPALPAGGTPTPPAAGPPTPPAGGSPVPPVAEDPGRRRRWPIAAAGVLLLVAVAAAAAVLAGGGGSSGTSNTANSTATPSGTRVDAELARVPTNKVDGFGNVKMRLTKNLAKVDITTSGLIDSPHAMHIHADALGTCPTGKAARDHNGHLAISTKDGAPFYGHVVTSLTTRGKTDSDSFLAFKRFPSTGSIKYSRTIDVGPVVAASIRQNGSAVVVIHGIDYNGNGTYDFSSLDESDLNRSLPGEETAPALCGALVARPGQSGGKTASASQVYTAALVSAPQAQSSPLFCDLRSLAGKLL
jgi:serine/threonine-protein kinase